MDELQLRSVSAGMGGPWRSTDPSASGDGNGGLNPLGIGFLGNGVRKGVYLATSFTKKKQRGF